MREKQRGVGAKKGSHRMVEIKLLCFRWLSPFLKLVQKGFSRICLRKCHLCSFCVGAFQVQWLL